MARMPRLVVPGLPHHVTQRGARRMKTFFSPDDYALYLDLASRYRAEAGVTVWAYCLMPNHVHFVVVPAEEDSLSRFFRRVHREYARQINRREQWQGHLWQERFHSFVMDDGHLLSTVRYVELNPVRAGLCSFAQEWPWSSTRAHLYGRADRIMVERPMQDRVRDWAKYLSVGTSDEQLNVLRRHSSTGRPAGSEKFVSTLEQFSGRILQKGRPGPRPAIKSTVPK